MTSIQNQALFFSIDPQALYARGVAFASGSEFDIDAAVSCFRQAADCGHAESIYILGSFLLHGIGLKKDPSMALKMYTHAAELKNSNALLSLAKIHFSGFCRPIIEANAKTGRDFLQKSAALGNKEAMYILSYCCRNGIGGEKDLFETERLSGILASENFFEENFSVEKLRGFLKKTVDSPDFSEKQKKIFAFASAFIFANEYCVISQSAEQELFWLKIAAELGQLRRIGLEISQQILHGKDFELNLRRDYSRLKIVIELEPSLSYYNTLLVTKFHTTPYLEDTSSS